MSAFVKCRNIYLARSNLKKTNFFNVTNYEFFNVSIIYTLEKSVIKNVHQSTYIYFIHDYIKQINKNVTYNMTFEGKMY